MNSITFFILGLAVLGFSVTVSSAAAAAITHEMLSSFHAKDAGRSPTTSLPSRRPISEGSTLEECISHLVSPNGPTFSLIETWFFAEEDCTCGYTSDPLDPANVSTLFVELREVQNLPGIFLLSCSSPDILFCNGNDEDCVTKEFQAFFSPSGKLLSRTLSVHYAEGLGDKLVIQVDGNSSFDEYDWDTPAMPCKAFINGDTCAKCEVNVCAANRYEAQGGFALDCGSVVPGAFIDQCKIESSHVTGILGALNPSQYRDPLHRDVSKCDEQIEGPLHLLLFGVIVVVAILMA